MKLTKLMALGIFLSIVLYACFRPDEFDETPQITYKSLVFVPSATGTNFADSLILTFDFQDGDGDLGLFQEETSPPYHSYYFIMDSKGEIVTLNGDFTPPFYEFTVEAVRVSFAEFLLRATFKEGKPVFSDFDNRPASFDCQYYLPDSIINPDIIPLFVEGNTTTTTMAPFPPYKIIEIQSVCSGRPCALKNSVSINGIPNTQTRIDTFFISKNESSRNIDVEFYRKKGDNYEIIDWTRAFSQNGCGLDFNARFPEFIDRTRGKALEGTISYAMASTGFRLLLRKDTFKIAVRIRDFNLNMSNTTESPDLTLQQIGG